MISPSKRLDTIQEYYFSSKLKEIANLNKCGADILNLGIGNPDLPPSSGTLKKASESMSREGNHGYQSYMGIPELRKAFSDWYKKYYQVILDPDNEILPLMGSKEGIFHISMAFLNPGDEVLVPDPGYPAYSAVSRLLGGRVIPYKLTWENGWYPDFNELKKRDLRRAKIMWVNYPHMPTGAPASKDLFNQIVAFGLEHKLLVCHDNPYSFILNDQPLSLLSVPGAKEVVLELNSLSKSHNMAGWRIGMVAGKTEFIKLVLKSTSNVGSGMFRVVQEAAVEALHHELSWYRQLNKNYETRRKIGYKILDALNCRYQIHQTGMFLWGKIPATEKEAYSYSDKILTRAKVFITPGGVFGEQGEQYLRLSLCSSESLLSKALIRINSSQNES